jgi:Tfp pilus assembly protein PilN
VIRINLAPPRQRPRAGWRWPEPNLGLLFAAVGVVLVITIGGWSWSLFREERRLSAEIDAGDRELTTLKAVVGSAAKVKEQLADLQARLKVIQALTKDQGRPLFLIDAFADTVPADLWITGLEDKGTVLKVSGSAFSATAISDLMTALRASGKFKDVDLVVSRRDLDKTPNLVTFEVTCRFEG